MNNGEGTGVSLSEADRTVGAVKLVKAHLVEKEASHHLRTRLLAHHQSALTIQNPRVSAQCVQPLLTVTEPQLKNINFYPAITYCLASG